MERRPAGVSRGIAAEADESIGDFTGADGTVEGLGIELVRVIYGESADYLRPVELSWAAGLATPST